MTNHPPCPGHFNLLLLNIASLLRFRKSPNNISYGDNNHHIKIEVEPFTVHCMCKHFRRVINYSVIRFSTASADELFSCCFECQRICTSNRNHQSAPQNKVCFASRILSSINFHGNQCFNQASAYWYSKILTTCTNSKTNVP